MQEIQGRQILSLGLGSSPGGGNDSPLQYYCLENPMDRGAYGVRYSLWDHKRVRYILGTEERESLKAVRIVTYRI